MYNTAEYLMAAIGNRYKTRGGRNGKIEVEIVAEGAWV